MRADRSGNEAYVARIYTVHIYAIAKRNKSSVTNRLRTWLMPRILIGGPSPRLEVLVSLSVIPSAVASSRRQTARVSESIQPMIFASFLYFYLRRIIYIYEYYIWYRSCTLSSNEARDDKDTLKTEAKQRKRGKEREKEKERSQINRHPSRALPIRHPSPPAARQLKSPSTKMANYPLMKRGYHLEHAAAAAACCFALLPTGRRHCLLSLSLSLV